MKNQATEKKSAVYDLRSNWPPYTYRDYPDIKPEITRHLWSFYQQRTHLRN